MTDSRPPDMCPYCGEGRDGMICPCRSMRPHAVATVKRVDLFGVVTDTYRLENERKLEQGRLI